METNPKDAIGRTKVPMSLFPPIAVAYGSVGMLEGMFKYGAVNYRAAPVAASVYLDAAFRHLAAWRDGEEYCVEIGDDGQPIELGPHLGNALACIAIILDARLHGTLIDDRPISNETTAFAQATEGLRKNVAALQKRFGHINPVHYTMDKVVLRTTAPGHKADWVTKNVIPAPILKAPTHPVPADMPAPLSPQVPAMPDLPGKTRRMPMHDKETLEKIEAEAQRIYKGWEHEHGYVPWVIRGNSDQQIEARRRARFNLGLS